jgi:hyaluronan synthase
MNERLPLLEPRLPSRFQERFWHKCIKYIPVTIFFSFIVYSYYNTNIELSTNLSVYGLFALLNYSSQFVMAVINKYKMDKISKSIDQGYIPIAVCVAGYREREDYFRNCLLSIKNSEYDNIQRIIVVIDGNSDEDKYMAKICMEVFGSNECAQIRLSSLMLPETAHANQKLISRCIDSFNTYRVLCIQQPHSGKRSAIFTAVQLCQHR